MLSERDRQVLIQIEHMMTTRDPRFADGIRLGRPRPPREYRRTFAIVLTVLAVAAFVTVVLTGTLVGVFVLVGVVAVGAARILTRRLDGH